MPHDKIKDAARRRMAETGETYATARREVIRRHREAARREPGPILCAHADQNGAGAHMLAPGETCPLAEPRDADG